MSNAFTEAIEELRGTVLWHPQAPLRSVMQFDAKIYTIKGFAELLSNHLETCVVTLQGLAQWGLERHDTSPAYWSTVQLARDTLVTLGIYGPQENDDDASPQPGSTPTQA